MNFRIKNDKGAIRHLFRISTIFLALFTLYFHIQNSRWERVDDETGQILDCVVKIKPNDKSSSDCSVRMPDGKITAVRDIKPYNHDNRLITLKVEVNKLRKKQKRYSKLDEK